MIAFALFSQQLMFWELKDNFWERDLSKVSFDKWAFGMIIITGCQILCHFRAWWLKNKDFDWFWIEFFLVLLKMRERKLWTVISRRFSYLNSNINPCMKVRKLLCRVKPPVGSRAIFPNTYRFQNELGAGLSKKGKGIEYKIEKLHSFR